MYASGSVSFDNEKMVELGIPRETAIYLFQVVFETAEYENLDSVEEGDIRKRISETYEEFPHLIKCQLEFLI